MADGRIWDANRNLPTLRAGFKSLWCNLIHICTHVMRTQQMLEKDQKCRLTYSIQPKELDEGDYGEDATSLKHLLVEQLTRFTE